LSQEVNEELVEMIENEHDLLEDKANTRKFAYMVIKNSYYTKLDQGF